MRKSGKAQKALAKPVKKVKAVEPKKTEKKD